MWATAKTPLDKMIELDDTHQHPGASPTTTFAYA
jgi:hypothetical protein